MINFISSQFLFYISILLVLFAPGYFLLLAVEARKKLFNSLERFVLSFGFSILITDFLMILMGKAGILFTRISIILATLIFSAICFTIHKIIRRNTFLRSKKSVTDKKEENNNLNFSKNQKILIIILLFLTIFIKTAYLKDSIFPSSTDLGHHMYWAGTISETGKLPVYQESDIVQVDGKYQVSQPQSIADFIIGEHLIFAAINLISGANFVSYFPSLVLMLVDIITILAIFILTLRLFEKYPQGKNVAILALLLSGPLYALSSPQEKFVSGGVIGNLIGDLLIPIILLLLFRSLKEKNRIILTLALFAIFGLFYTHHLSAFIFLFIFAFIFIFFLVLNLDKISDHFKDWTKLVLSPPVIAILISFFLFFFFVFKPSYFEPQAIGTAVGGPSKETRAGLTFNQIKTTAGEARMVLGIIGIVILLAVKKRKTYQHAILLGWGISILVMTVEPQWLFIDLPSGRIADYISFPLSIIAAFALVWTFEKMKSPEGKNYLNSKMIYALGSLMLIFVLVNGFYDNSQSLSTSDSRARASQTFNASAYLAGVAKDSNLVVKDHNYIAADSWIKLFFNQGYNYPFSRGYFKRYEDTTKPREMCTLWMISEPNTENGQKCFSDLGVNFMMVNPAYDSAQFQKSADFWQIYSGKEINIYYRN